MPHSYARPPSSSVALAVGDVSYPIDGGGGSSAVSGITVQSWYGGGSQLGGGCWGMSFEGGGPGGGSYPELELAPA